MSKTTKTLNPLHFEDLEPHRFEDLVRQLAYDFRNWRSLEPTGFRPGSRSTMKFGRAEKLSGYKDPPVRAARMEIPVENQRR